MISSSEIVEQAQTAADFVLSNSDGPRRFGIILGTGAGVLASAIQQAHSLEYAEIPHFPVSTAPGHQGRLLLGQIRGQAVVAMDGRFHLYEGHDVDRATLAIRVMQRLGVEILFITNASGGINPIYRSGEVMAIRSHVDLMFRQPVAAVIPNQDGRPIQRADAYDPSLIELARQTARQQNFALHTGIYGALLGPTYETRAEYRMLRRIGVDVAGMSTVPEVVVAASLGMRILGLSVITNVARPDALAPTSGQQVIDAAETAAPQISAMVSEIIAAEAG